MDRSLEKRVNIANVERRFEELKNNFRDLIECFMRGGDSFLCILMTSVNALPLLLSDI